MMRGVPDTKCDKCHETTVCRETLDGFICLDCFLKWFQCNRCGLIIHERYIIIEPTNDRTCPVCFANNSFRQLEAF